MHSSLQTVTATNIRCERKLNHRTFPAMSKKEAEDEAGIAAEFSATQYAILAE